MKPQTTLACACLWAAGLAVAQAVDPEQRLRQLTIEQLSQIEVTSVTKEPVTAFQSPAAINVLTNADIRRSGARNLPDLLRLIPGVHVAQIYSNQWAIGIRGFQNELSKSVLVLIDGRSVYTPLFAGVFWDMQDVFLEDVDRIEVIRGPAGVIWGSNAVNGVINIITKNARDTRGAIVQAGVGNVDQGFLNWRYGAGDDTFSYRIYGKGATIGPQFHSDGQNYDDWRRGQIGFRIDAASNQDALTIQGDVYGAEAGQILRLHSYSPPSSRLSQAEKYFNGQNIMAAWRRSLASGADIQVRTYYDRTDREEQNFHEIRHTFDIDFIHHMPVRRHDFTWGLGTRISPATFEQILPTVDFQPHNHVYNIFSAFVQDEIALVPNRLALTLGSKFEYTTWSGFNAQPSARISWTPKRTRTYWAAVTRAVRTASWIEDNFRFDAFAGTGQSGVPSFFRLLGDGGFRQESMIGLEAGYRQNIAGHGFASITLFHNNYDDLLSIEPSRTVREGEPDMPRDVLLVPFRDGLRAKTSGGEVAGLWDITEWWRARSSYSLVKIDARPASWSIDQGTTRQVQSETPSHKFLAQSSFALPLNFDLDVIYRYVSSVPGFRVPSYSTGDVRFARRIGNFAFEIVGRNLLQPRHLEYGVENPPVAVRRAGFLRFTWTH